MIKRDRTKIELINMISIWNDIISTPPYHLELSDRVAVRSRHIRLANSKCMKLAKGMHGMDFDLKMRQIPQSLTWGKNNLDRKKNNIIMLLLDHGKRVAGDSPSQSSVSDVTALHTCITYSKYARMLRKKETQQL